MVEAPSAWGLRAKLVAAASVILLALWLVGYHAAARAEHTLDRSVQKSARRLAVTHREALLNAVEERFEMLRTIAASPRLFAVLRESNAEFASLPDRNALIARRETEWTSGAANRFRDDIDALPLSKEFASKVRRGGGFAEIFLTNRFGVNVAQSNATSDYIQSDEIWWTRAREAGSFVGRVGFDESAGITSIPLSLSIQDPDTGFLGVIKAVYDLSDVFRLIQLQSGDGTSEDRPVLTVLDERNRIVRSSHPARQVPGEDGSVLLRDVQAYGTSTVFVTTRFDPRLGNDVLVACAFGDPAHHVVPLAWTIICEFDRAALMQPVHALRRQIYGVVLLVTVAMAAIILLFSRSLVGRLTVLTTATRRITLGDHEVTLEPLGGDEVGCLAHHFNAMVRGLRDGASALSANEAKSAFLAAMSHEIRTPLTAIIGYSDLVASEDCRAEDRGQFVNAIRGSATHLLGLINDILDLSKIEAGRVEIVPRRKSTVEIVATVMELTAHAADRKRLRLDALFEGPVPESLIVDETRLRQILVNLVGNGIKFTHEGGVRIVLRHLERGELEPQIRFEVIDSGIGMTPAAQDRIFEAFTQATNETERTFGGTGLGLTISRHFASLMGGELTVRSVEGSGTTFTLTLPTGNAAGAPLMTNPQEALALHRRAPDVEVDPKLSLPGKRILLAEDNLVNQRLMGIVLRKADLEVTVAKDGEEAVALVQEAEAAGRPYDLVLMDLQMPVMDGTTATQRLRDLGFELPIVALTADAFQDTRDRCMRSGFTGYVTKPVKGPELIAAVRRYLEEGALITSDSGRLR